MDVNGPNAKRVGLLVMVTHNLTVSFFGKSAWPGRPQQKAGWRNLVGGAPVDLTHAGAHLRQANAQALQMPADAGQILPALANLAANGAKPFGVPADGSPPPDGFVLVVASAP